MTDAELIEEILSFVEQYAKVSAAYEPSIDDESERFNGPDSAMLYGAAISLQRGEKFGPVNSAIGSGCYRMWTHPGVAERHDVLVREINKRSVQ